MTKKINMLNLVWSLLHTWTGVLGNANTDWPEGVPNLFSLQTPWMQNFWQAKTYRTCQPDSKHQLAKPTWWIPTIYTKNKLLLGFAKLGLSVLTIGLVCTLYALTMRVGPRARQTTTTPHDDRVNTTWQIVQGFHFIFFFFFEKGAFFLSPVSPVCLVFEKASGTIFSMVKRTLWGNYKLLL